MEGPSSAQPSVSSPTASKPLANLPSRGLFSSPVLSSHSGGMRAYVCERDTSPPEHQCIRTDQQNILIRALTLRKQRGESGSNHTKCVAVGDGSRKRASERLLDNGVPAKRPSSQASSRQDGLDANIRDKDLHSLTVERLRALLKEQGLSP